MKKVVVYCLLMFMLVLIFALPVYAQVTYPEYDYAEQVMKNRRLLRLQFKSIHRRLVAADLYDAFGLPEVLVAWDTIEQMHNWRIQDRTDVFATMDDDAKSKLVAALQRFNSFFDSAMQVQALLAKKYDWRQREGAAWAFVQDPGNVITARRDFLKRFQYVEAFGWYAKTHAEKLLEGKLRQSNRWLALEDLDKKHSEWEQAWKIETEHFLIRGDISYKKLKELSYLFEAEYDFFVMSFKDALPMTIPSQLLEIYIFKNQHEYLEKFKKYTGKDAGEEGGRFDSKSNRGYFFFYDNLGELRREIDFRHVCLHEVQHLLFHNLIDQKIGEAVTQPHIWVMEGLADYFALLRIEGLFAYKPNKASLLESGRFARAKTLLVEERLVPLKHFVAMDLKSFYSSVGGGIDRYAQATMLIYYLMDRYPKESVEYVRRIMVDAKGKSTALKGYFSATRDCEREFLRWFKGVIEEKK